MCFHFISISLFDSHNSKISLFDQTQWQTTTDAGHLQNSRLLGTKTTNKLNHCPQNLLVQGQKRKQTDSQKYILVTAMHFLLMIFFYLRETQKMAARCRCSRTKKETDHLLFHPRPERVPCVWRTEASQNGVIHCASPSYLWAVSYCSLQRIFSIFSLRGIRLFFVVVVFRMEDVNGVDWFRISLGGP